jgi:N-acetylneuraminate lyase
MPPIQPLHGLVTATHTPFHADGSLNLSAVEAQAAHLSKDGVATVFIAGTTGESSSLTLDERLNLTDAWCRAVRGTPMRIVVHVGSNCLADARRLAADAAVHGVAAIAALSPSYFKPRSVDTLIDCCADIAAAAPETPFYYYDIPSMTGVSLPMPEFLEKAATRIPNLAGLKFTNPDLMAYLQCLRSGAWDIPWGMDEALLAALATGARGAVGSTYNFAAPLYHRLFEAFKRGDLEAARTEQYRGTQLITVLAKYNFMAAAKATMQMLRIDVGPPRLPNPPFTPTQTTELRTALESLGFFDWLK